MKSALVWAAVITLSTLAAVAAVRSGGGSTLHALTIGWFLFVCPGLAFVRLIRLGNPYVVPGFAVASSLAIDMAVAEFLLYTGNWSATTGVTILAGISLVGAALQFVATTTARRPDKAGARILIRYIRKG